ncbi:MAG TPA: IPT/TIG domain-containing protein [Myxococcales bacterium]|nr:IPT/TIG domain-containing protein [Myxococcales bacterium]
MRRLRNAFAAAALLLPALAACNRQTGSSDSGPPVTVIPTQGLDGGPDAGAVDAGQKVDAGPNPFQDAGPVPVKVTEVSPDRGGVAGGTPVTISGSGFLSGLLSDPTEAATVTVVSFGGNPSLGVTVLTDGTLQVTSPPGLAGPADVTVQNPNGSATCTGCFDYQSTIEVAQVSPGIGPTTGGTSVVVSGLGFDASTIVLFGPHALINAQLVSPTTIIGLTPPAALAGPVDVRAFNANGAALLHGAFTYFEKPTIASLTPASGPTSGGTSVTLKGTGFLGEQPAVTIGGQTATAVTVVDDQTLTLLTPPGAVGAADVVVQDADGAATLPGGFVYFPAAATQLAIYGVAPDRGPAAGGTSVTLVGAGFAGSPQVDFGGAAASVTLLDANDLAVTTPAGAVGPVTVSVTQAGSTVSLAGAFTYYAGRTLTSVGPASGPTAGGNQAALTGTGFAAGDRVFFGPLEATATQVTSATSITVTVPPGTAGPENVEVVAGSDPTITALLPDGYVYLDSFTLTQVAPASGSQAGGTYVQLLGTGFSLGIGATFAGNAATNVALVDGYTVSCLTPPGNPGPADVTVSQPGASGSPAQTATLAGGFSYFDPTNIAGGESGGPLDGTLNVTVLDDDYTAPNQPIPGTLVRLGVDPRTPFQGVTDVHGQITFSDPSLVKAQTVTADYQGVVAITVDDVASQNLTVFLDVPMSGGSLPSACPCGAPPDCPQNCGLPYCGALGTCVQCLTDADCQNPAIPGYDPTKPKCNPPPVAGTPIGGFCVQCIPEYGLTGQEELPNPDCKGNPNGPACDDDRGLQSTYTCVQCSADQACASPDYCDQSLMCVPPDQISGAVYGFKLPSSVTLSPTQSVVAHVGLIQPYVYAYEPFSPDPPEVTVPVNGGTFQISLNEGPLTLGLYAKFGIVDGSTTPPTFTPYLLGVLRGLHVDPNDPVTNANIVLDTHLDQTAPISLAATLAPPAPVGGVTDGNPVHYDTFGYFDLGQDGIVPLSDVDSTSATAQLGGLPPVSGSGVLFLTQAYQPPAAGQAPFADPSQRQPESNFFRSVQSDFTTGVPMGPLLSFASFTHPAAGGTIDGTFAWSFTDPTAPAPDLSQLTLYWTEVDGSGNQVAPLTQLWQIIVPGSQTSVTIPDDALSEMLQTLPASSPGSSTFVAWVLVTVTAPRFDYDFWSYQELSELSWTGFQVTSSGTFP